MKILFFIIRCFTKNSAIHGFLPIAIDKYHDTQDQIILIPLEKYQNKAFLNIE